jgi:hypothetical protein
MAREDALLLLVTGPDCRPGSKEVARRLVGGSGSFRWSVLADRARLGQVAPLAYAGLQRLGLGTGSDPHQGAAVEVLKRAYVGNSVRSQRIASILTAILSSLQAEGIEVMAHKGIALAAAVYGDPSLRIMGDLDLCVRDGDRSRAEAAVADLCAELVRQNPDRRHPAGFHVELDGTSHHDLDPSRTGSGRWGATNLDWDGIWARSLVIDHAGHALRIPEPTDLLLTLVTNALRRGMTPVRLVCDIAYVVHVLGQRMDWGRFESDLRSTRLDRRSWVPLGLAVDWFGVDVPPALLEPPQDLATAWFERAILGAKHLRPVARVPTRVLWAGSWRQAALAGARLGAARLTGGSGRWRGRSKRPPGRVRARRVP